MQKINFNLLKYKNPTTGEFENLHAFVGKSAYETAKEGGFTGTEEEFAAALANHGSPQIQPLFMDSMEELEANGDTSKLYILPDNFIYAYKDVADVPSGSTYTNQIPISTDTSGNVVGLIENHRYNSSDVLVELDGVNATGFIPCKKGDTLYFKNIEFGPNSERYGVSYIRFYDSNHTLIAGLYGDLGDVKNYSTSYSTDANGYLTSLLVDGTIITDDCAYMRMCFDPTDEEAIVTVNEPIEGSTSSGNYTNLAEPLPDNTTDTTKWVNGYRLSSSDISAQSGTTLSNLIPCKSGDVIRIKGVTLRENEDRVALHVEGNAFDELTKGYFNVGININSHEVVYNGLENGVYTFTIGNWDKVIDGFRFAMPTPTDASQVIVTVNEELDESSGGYTNLFNTSGDGFTDETTKFYTNWLPYNQTDNGGTGTIYHFKGLAVPDYPNPYKMQFKSSGGTSAQIYCANANVQPATNASYDSSVKIVQHNTNSTDYIFVQFEMRETLPSNLIITANEDIVGEAIKPSGRTNLFDTSTATLNNRLNSSGELKTDNGAGGVVTDFIPYVQGINQYLYVKNAHLLITGSMPYTKVALYDASKGYIGCTEFSSNNSSSYVTALGDKYEKVAIKDLPNISTASYIRVVLCPNGDTTALTEEDIADIIMKYDEEITETEDQPEQPTLGKAWTNTGHAFIPTEYDSQIATLTNKTNANATNISALTNTAVKQSKDIATLKTNVDNLASGKTNTSLPTYWEEYLPSKIAAIKALQETGGKDCFSFPLLTDIHISVNLGKRSGLLAKRIMDECNMKYAVCCGDVITRGANKTKEQTEQNYAQVEELLKPIRSQLLQTQGNHDGSWGAEDLDGDGDVEGTEYYCYNYTPQLNYERIYRKVGLVGDVHFDKTGSGYWIDDVSNKVRYIGMNSHCNKYEENADGTAVYNNMRVFRLTQSQFDMTIEALTTIPNDEWSVLSFSHAPLNNRDGSMFADRIVMRDMLNAYKNKTSYKGTYGTSGNYDYVTVDVDFSSAKGQYIAHFSGHTHTDTVTTDFGIPIITTRCDGNEENDATLNAEKVIGTVTEQSFDIFTVNKAEGKIYATKIGAGDDRIITFGGGNANLFIPSNAKVNTRLNSSYVETSADGSFVSDYIDFSYATGSRMIIKGLAYPINSTEVTNRIVFFDGNKTGLTHFELNTTNASLFTIDTSNLNEQVITFKSIPSGTSYIRLTLYKNNNSTNAITSADIQNIEVYIK